MALMYVRGPDGEFYPVPSIIGNTPNLTVGEVTTLPAGSPATVTITGTPDEPVLNFGIPEGQSGISTITAENVLFTSNLVLTAPIGVHTIPASGSLTLPTKGKNLKQVLDMIVAEEKNPTVTQPSVTVTLNGAGAKEAGTNVTPSYSCVLNPGSYQFGPETGIVAESWSVADKNSNSATTASGSFPQFQVVDGTNYSVTATAQYQEGAVPVTNLGNPYPAGKIAAGSKSATKGSITSYRNTFWGTLTSKDGAIDNALVRGLPSKSNSNYANGKTFTIQVPVGALRVVFAYPATLREVTSVKDVNGLNAEIKTAFKLSTVNVAGANNYNPISYKVYVYDMAEPNGKANSFTVTI